MEPLLRVLLLALAARVAPDAPVLSIEAPPQLAALAARLEAQDRSRCLTTMSMLGLDEPGPPIRVVLAVEGSPEARAAPSWAAGYAHGSEGFVVLMPSRASSYPYDSLETLLQHEIAHVLISRAVAGRPIPRWFNEGVAMAASGAWDFEDRTRLVLELLPGERPSFDRVDGLFAEGPAQARRAYALSGAFVRDLLRRHGADTPARILAGVARGSSFDEALHLAIGTTLLEAEASFYATQNIWSRWVPFLTSTLTLWMVISLLALVARRRRRERDAHRAAEWEREEGGASLS